MWSGNVASVCLYELVSFCGGLHFREAVTPRKESLDTVIANETKKRSKANPKAHISSSNRPKKKTMVNLLPCNVPLFCIFETDYI